MITPSAISPDLAPPARGCRSRSRPRPAPRRPPWPRRPARRAPPAARSRSPVVPTVGDDVDEAARGGADPGAALRRSRRARPAGPAPGPAAASASRDLLRLLERQVGDDRPGRARRRGARRTRRRRPGEDHVRVDHQHDRNPVGDRRADLQRRLQRRPRRERRRRGGVDHRARRRADRRTGRRARSGRRRRRRRPRRPPARPRGRESRPSCRASARHGPRRARPRRPRRSAVPVQLGSGSRDDHRSSACSEPSADPAILPAVARRVIPRLLVTRPLDDLGQVLVAAAGEAEDVIALAPAVLEQPGDRVGGLERRDDPLQPRQLGEGGQRLRVGDRVVAWRGRVSRSCACSGPTPG